MKYTKEQKAEWCEYVARVGSIKETAEHFNIDPRVMGTVVRDVHQKYITERNQAIINLRHTNKSISEIADELNLSWNIVSGVCKKAGLGGQLSDRKADYVHMRRVPPDVDKAIQYINLRGFDYVGGYVGSDGHVIIKCRVCGCEFDINYPAIRKGHRVNCPKCTETNRLLNEEQKRIEQEANRIERSMSSWRRKIAKAKTKERRLDSQLHLCPICGKPTLNKSCCSDNCQRTYNNRTHEQQRRAKMKDALVDNDIQLMELYRRDKGVCHICGGVCDFNDKTITEEGHFITGGTYPTIDHVVPLAKGGKHEWSNVKLAHFKCNSQKRDRIISSQSPARANV